jgi:hypothetical protein
VFRLSIFPSVPGPAYPVTSAPAKLPVALDSGLPALGVEIGTVEALCREALEKDYPDLAAKVPDLPQDSDRWLELLRGLPDDRRCRRLLRALCEGAERLGACRPGSIERYGLLKASLSAFPKLMGSRSHDCLTRQFCATFQRVATRAQGWGRHFRHDTDAFTERARIVTFRRFHAGQYSFDVMPMPKAWLLKVHPLALPRLARELALGLGGFGPIVMPHVNYWRLNPMVLSEKESDLSHYRIVQYLEQEPQIRGMVSASWLYSSEAKAFAPHIAWLREFYAENGALLLDMEVAHEAAGFLVGSEERRRLYAEGQLRPRETLLIWPREKMLAWAQAYAGKDGRTALAPLASAPSARRAEPKWQTNANAFLSSGQYTLLDWRLFLRHKPRQYIAAVFLVPLLILTIGCIATVGMAPALPIIVMGFIGIWLLQYFFLQ